MPNDQDYAIVIGINDYDFLRPLTGPVQDALAFQKWLFSPSGGYLPNHIMNPGTLQHVFFIQSTTNPSKPIQDDIDDCLMTIKKNGAITGFRRFYFFFAGHGLGVDWKQNALCLPKWSTDYLNAALSSSEYLDFIVSSGLFQEVFFFLDCCRDRKAAARPLHPQLGWARAGAGVANCSSLVVYGSRFDNPSYESVYFHEREMMVNGYLSRALIDALKGAAANPQGEITILTLKSFLKSKVEELAKAEQRSQTVQFEDRFTPNAVVVNGLPKSVIVTNIDFTINGDFQLEDPLLNIIQEEQIQSPGKWTLELEKGTYTLTEKNSNRAYYLKLDGTQNPFHYAVND